MSLQHKIGGRIAINQKVDLIEKFLILFFYSATCFVLVRGHRLPLFTTTCQYSYIEIECSSSLQ